MDVEDVKEVSKKKIAGIPVLYIVAGVSVIFLIVALRTKNTTDTTTTDTTTDTGTDSGSDYLSGDASQTPLVSNPVFTANPAPATSYTEDTNDLWARRAIQWLIASGSTATQATNAIQKYLSGESLSFDEGKLRDQAVTEFGLPPEDFSAGKTNGYNGPATKQGEPPTRHTVKGKSDNSFEELTRLYYGLSNADAIAFLRSRNAGMVEPFAVGQTVMIPAWKNPHYYRATSATRTLYAIARVNNSTPARITELNPGMEFPVKPSTRVRVR